MSKLSRKSLLCVLFAPVLPLVAKSAKSKTFGAGGPPPLRRRCMVSTQSPEIYTFGDTRRVITTPQVATILSSYQDLIAEQEKQEIQSRARRDKLVQAQKQLDAKVFAVK